MTISYALRLFCVCLAAFAIIFTIVGSTVSLFAGAAIRAAERFGAARAASFVLALRLLPSFAAALVVAAVCVPSYLRFEQRSESEEIGIFCLALATVTATVFARTIFRTALAWRDSVRPSAVLALVGILRQRILISDAARNSLSPSQLAMAIQHERAHARSLDNLKRFAISITPRIFPGFPALEQAWKRFAEWAADDRAADGDPQRALSLAGALVQVAKLGITAEPAPLVTSFLASANDLEARVERLLNPKTPAREPRYELAAGVAVCGAMVLAATMHPAAVHDLLERLIH